MLSFGDMPAQTDLPKAERALRYEFKDANLGISALDGAGPAWNRLEYLGDAIMGLSVHTVVVCTKMPLQEVKRLCSNQYLKSIAREHLTGCSVMRSGDVVETLLAAVYLDGGFLNAAQVATSLLLPEHQGFNFTTTETVVDSIEGRSLFSLGAHVAKAVTADHLSTQWSSRTKKIAYHKETSFLLERSRLESISTKHNLTYLQRGSAADQKDVIDGYVAREFLTLGWDVAKTRIAKLLEIAPAPSR